MFNKRSLYFLVILFANCVTTQAQDNKDIARQLLEVADEIYTSTKAYIQARDAYVQVLDYDPENLKANFMAGTLFLDNVNREKATPYFLKAYSIDPNYSFDLLFKIGRSYQFGLDFESAINYYHQYLEKLGNYASYSGKDLISSAEVGKRIKECETAKKLTSNPLNYNITSVGVGINSEWPDYGPTINRDESELIFTSRRNEGNTNENVFDDNFPYEDIFVSHKENGEWGKAENIGPLINSLYFESSLTLSKDGKQLFIYEGEDNGDIYVSVLDNKGSWLAPVPLEDAINTSFKETSVNISPDGNVIFFASDRPGSTGGLDIFYSVKDRRGRWVTVKNAGAVINTPEDEDFPFIDYDGKTLYFSSQGHDGMGGYDIYKSVFDSARQEWIEPVNIGYPINTPDNDISFVTTVDGKRGYYSSVKQDSYGYEDIYMCTIPEEIRKIDEQTKEIEKKPDIVVTEPDKTKPAIRPVNIILHIKDETGSPIDAIVQFRNMDDKYEGAVSRTSTGNYSATAKFDTPKKCTISAEKNGYMYMNKNILVPVATSSDQRIEETLVIRKLQAGNSMVLRNIYFDFDKSVLKQESFIEINKLFNMLSENSRLIAEIAGYTDNVGAKDYNYKLSFHRAKVVVDYLLKKGIDPIRIKASGYGEESPLATNDDEKDGRELNRRVEFKVLRYLQ